jgi:UDP-glucose 4-epimerase
MADVLVAGGAGFIGSRLTRALVDRGESVTIISTGAPRPTAAFPKSVQTIRLDLRDRAAVMSALKGKKFHKVFNLAGYIDHTPFAKGGRAVLDQHFAAVENLIEAVSGDALDAFVQAGSSDEYGNAPSPQREDMREAPISPYSIGKTAATHLIQTLSQTEKFPAVVVRLFLTYGPGQDDRRFIPQIIKGCREKRKFDTSEGKQLRDFCYVDDTVAGFIAASEKKAARGHVINVASGKPVTIRSVVEMIVDICGSGEPVFGSVPYRPGENLSLYADITKAKTLLGWTPKVELSTGLRKTVEQYLVHG